MPDRGIIVITENDLELSLKKLYNRRRFGIKPGLEVVESIMEQLDHPDRSYGIIHVAGTNGKGSVCTFLESVLRFAGYKVGLYTSPHLIKFNERIRVAGFCIKDDALGSLINKIEESCSAVVRLGIREPTFFEYVTAMALEYFRAQKIDIAILETGMGGRLDATNIVTPLVSVITRISLEHSMYLGDDIKDIAKEKAGIIKEGRPVVCGAMPKEAEVVISQTATRKGALVVNAFDNVTIKSGKFDLCSQNLKVDTSNMSYGNIYLPLSGKYQIENLATAIATLEILQDITEIDITEDMIKGGIADVKWSGRFQVIKQKPLIILDGAHNPYAATALAETLKHVNDGKPLSLVVGMCKDKDIKKFLNSFSGLVERLWVVPIKNERNANKGEIISIGKNMGWHVSDATLSTALAESEKWAIENKGAVCITGSLFLAGEVLVIIENTGDRK